VAVTACTVEGRPGFRWGASGTVYAYDAGDESGEAAARGLADADGAAVAAAQLFAGGKGLRFVAVGDRADDDSVWIEIVRTGAHHAGHVGGTASSGQDKIEIDREFIDSLHRGTEAVLSDGRYPSGIPVRLDPTHADDTGPACGRIVETATADLPGGGSRLLARVTWGAEGRRVIEAGEYDSVSIEADPPGALQHKGTGEAIDEWALTGLVITNHPFIAGMEPLAASDRLPEERDMSLIKLLLPALALAEGSTEAAVLAEVQRLKTAAEKSEALTESVRTLTEDRDKVAAEAKSLSEWKSKRMLDDACTAGRITAAERERYSRVVASLGEEEANAIFPDGRIKTAATSTSGANPDAEGAPTGPAAQLAEIQTEAKQIEADQGLNPAAAFAEAHRRAAERNPGLKAFHNPTPQA